MRTKEETVCFRGTPSTLDEVLEKVEDAWLRPLLVFMMEQMKMFPIDLGGFINIEAHEQLQPLLEDGELAGMWRGQEGPPAAIVRMWEQPGMVRCPASLTVKKVTEHTVCVLCHGTCAVEEL